MRKENDEGIISIFIVFGMIFLLIFTINIYYIVKNKSQIQENKEFEIKKIYSDNYNELQETEYADSDEVIPVYNVEELNLVGTNNYVQIREKIYQCGRGKSYVLKDNIIIDINEKIKNNIIEACDYKLYSSTYYIDKNIYDIYYFKDGLYWKNIAYQKFDKDSSNILNDTKYTENEFSILREYNFKTGNNDFMLIWTDETGRFVYEESAEQILYQTKLNRLEEIDVFRNNQGNLNKTSGEYYLFVCIGNSI